MYIAEQRSLGRPANTATQAEDAGRSCQEEGAVLGGTGEPDLKRTAPLHGTARSSARC